MNQIYKIERRLLLVVVLIGLLVIGFTDTAQAADFRGGENVVIEADEVIDDDLFVSGNRVEINGTIKGDLFASGREIIVNGPVEGSLMIAGQTLQVNSTVDGSLYGAGYALTLGPDSNVARNLYFGGFSLKTETGSIIGRSLHAGDYQTVLNGAVERDVMIEGGALELYGRVGGDVFARVSPPEEEIPPMMPFFSGAVPVIPSGFRMADSTDIAGTVDVKETAPPQTTRGADVVELGSLAIPTAIANRIGEFIALLIVGSLFLYFGASFMEKTSDHIQATPLPSIGWGLLIALLFFIAVPIAALTILLVALLGGLLTFGQLFGEILMFGGASLTLLVVIFAITLTVVTKSVVAFFGGRLILSQISPNLSSGFSKNLIALSIGVFIYELLRVIPFGLGWLIGVIVTLTGLGAIYFLVRGWQQPSITDESVVATPQLNKSPA